MMILAKPRTLVRVSMKSIAGLFVLLLLLFASSARAEIEKLALTCEQGICMYWWPKLPAVKGWHHDREHSFTYSANAQAPDGYSFADAESVIYAKAVYKAREPETKSLAMLIKNDKKEFLSRDPRLVISEVESLLTSDGKSMKSYTFFPKEKGNWERVTYGEEGDFYLIFTLSLRSKEAYQRALNAYEQFVNGYRTKQ